MKTRINSFITALAIIPMIMGFLAFPSTTEAAWTDIFGSFGGGNSGYSDPNSTASQHNGDIRLSKRVRRVNQDQNYHETTVIRSGTLVEIWIEVKNNSSAPATVTVTDELGGNVVYKKDSLRVNGQASGPGLTSGGLRLNMPAKSVYVITYQMYVCGGSTYAIRANAYSAGVGSATDAIIIQEEYSQYNNGYGNQYSACMNQLQNVSSGSSNQAPSVTYQSQNPFGDWTGVNNASGTVAVANNPFAGWTGVNNTSSTAPAASNPFAGWTGVNNSSTTSATVNNPFGDWTGVNNASTVTNTSTQNTQSNNPFAGWTGVNNASAANSTVNNPFGDWYGTSSTGNSGNSFGEWQGVSNSNSVNNPFGDWTGVNNSGYDMQGYSNSSSNTTSAVASNPTVASASSTNARSNLGSTYAATTTPETTYYVAPTTGVSKTAPIWFGALLVVSFFLFRQRKWLFN